MDGLKRFYRMVSSMRFGLALMGLGAAFLGVGGLLVEGGVADTLVFRVLLGIVLVNMAACTVNQTVQFAKSFGRGESGAKKTRRAALIALHGGIVLVLLGGAFNKFEGFGEKVLLFQGESADIAAISEGKYPYSLTVNGFTIEYNSNRTASQYFVDITMNDAEQEERLTLSVNAPASYRGVKIYYSEYFNLYQINTLTKEGRFRQTECWEKEYAELPEDAQTALMPLAFDPGVENDETRPPLVFHALANGEEEERILHAELGKWYDLEPGLFYQFGKVKPHVVLAVKAQPGNGLCAFGAFLIFAGTLLAFFRKKEGS
jgi:hypothetical protein